MFKFRPFGQDPIDDARKGALLGFAVCAVGALLLFVDDRSIHKLNAWSDYGEPLKGLSIFLLAVFLGVSLFVHFFRTFWDEVVLELKRVTWPSRAEVRKNTSLVLGVMFFFSMTVFLYDRLFQFVFRRFFGFFPD